ncbi:hypothetical protein FA95DRAFT_957131 [Auriscalpium vulgare]|uniref:Uncharacterized protein n=1 Tax=Auriscalpium vulgare TaxID=40419 RepID=A0ACB8RYX3_9AGAM|nr:hypothetical protein FA95DRAFT_957131 [Auriscalpium vulgare]
MYLVLSWGCKSRKPFFSRLSVHFIVLPGPKLDRPIFLGTSGSRSDEHSLCVSFTEDPLPTLHAPTTEIVWITAKTGAFTDKVVTALDRLAGFGNDPHSPTIGTAYGKVLDEPGMFLVLMGWTSVEEHYSTREDKAYKLGEIATELMGLADVKLAHVHFRAA